MEICSSYRCAVTQQQSTAALFRAQCNPLYSVLLCKTGSQQAVTKHKCPSAVFRAKCTTQCSVLLCKTGSQQAVCHCSYTYGDWLFIQVYSDPATKHCSTAQGKMQFPLFSVALQNRLTAGSVSLQLHLRTFALHTGVQ